MKLLFIMSCLCAIACLHANTQEAENFSPSEIAPVVYAIEANQTITIDGKLNETCWQKASVVKDFFRMEPRQAGNYLYPSEVRVLFDKKYLYFGVWCKDSLGKKGIRVQDFRRDFIANSNDEFFISLDPQNLKRYCVSFHASPLGTQGDGQIFDDTNRDNDWDVVWKLKSNVTDSGYYLEYAIPFTSLRYNKQLPGDSATWGVTFARLTVRNFEKTVFPAIPQTFSPYRMVYAAQLKGLQLPPPSLNLRINPYTVLQYDKSKTNNIISEKTKFKAGGEVKWAINPHAVIDATINTDFAQADVDKSVTNLTRFNVFFPEKRQFFLENSGVFAGADITNVKPFFSRTIGLSNTQFDADPVPINAGMRYTDRNQQRTIAGMYVHQQGTNAQGASNFGIIRYLKNYGKQNAVGAMITHRLDEDNSNKGFGQRNNTTLSIDGIIRPKDDITIQYIATSSRDNSNDSIGFAGSFYVGWFPNKAYFYYWTDFVSEKYVPGMGYVFAGNTIRNSAGGYFIWRPKDKLGKRIRRWDPGIFFTSYHNVSDGKFQSAEIDLFPLWIFFRNNNAFFMDVFLDWEQYFFSPLGIQIRPGKYFYTQINPHFETDASKKLSGTAGVQFGKYYNGTKAEANFSIRIAPLPHLALTGEYSAVSIRNLGVNKTDLDYSIIAAGARLAANPKLQASVFYQYNSFTKQGGWNVRGSWEFAPLSFVYLVFNDNTYRATGDKTQSYINKISYIKQF